MKPTVQRILIIQLKRLGDFILTVPVVPSLRGAFPSAEFVMVVPAAVADLARCVSQVDRVIPFHQGRLNLETWASALAGEWDVCLDFTGTDRSALLTKLSMARHRLGYAKHARRLRSLAYTELCDASVRDLHTLDFHLALVHQPGVFLQEAQAGTVFDIPGKVKSTVTALLGNEGIRSRYAIVHPGTAREEKFWMDERWAEVCAHLQQHHGLQVVLTGSGDGLETPHLEALRRMLRVPVVDLTGRLNLVEFAVVVAGCSVIVGVDSMAMHLAALCGKPQLALFGPTNPFHWRPRHGLARVLTPFSDDPVTDFTPKMKKGVMRGISTDAVKRALDALIA